MHKVAIIIPAKDESQNIGSVIQEIQKILPKSDIIVIDDHSKDSTGEIVKSFKNTILLKSPVTLGIGGAFQLGVQYAYKKGYERYIRMDGDGQHPARHIPQLIKKMQPGYLVVGSRSLRDFSASSNWVRKLGSIYFSSLFIFFLHKKIPDPTSGFVCFGKDVAKCLSEFLPSDFPEIEMEVLLLRAGFKIHSEQITMNSRLNGSSHIDLIHSVVYVFSVSIAFFISFIKKNPYHTNNEQLQN